MASKKVYKLSESEKSAIEENLRYFDGTNTEEIITDVGQTVVGLYKEPMKICINLMKIKAEKLLQVAWIPPKNSIEDYMIK